MLYSASPLAGSRTRTGTLASRAGILASRAGILAGRAGILAGKAGILAGRAGILAGKADIVASKVVAFPCMLEAKCWARSRSKSLLAADRAAFVAGEGEGDPGWPREPAAEGEAEVGPSTGDRKSNDRVRIRVRSAGVVDVQLGIVGGSPPGAAADELVVVEGRRGECRSSSRTEALPVEEATDGLEVAMARRSGASRRGGLALRAIGGRARSRNKAGGERGREGERERRREVSGPVAASVDTTERSGAIDATGGWMERVPGARQGRRALTKSSPDRSVPSDADLVRTRWSSSVSGPVGRAPGERSLARGLRCVSWPGDAGWHASIGGPGSGRKGGELATTWGGQVTDPREREEVREGSDARRAGRMEGISGSGR